MSEGYPMTWMELEQRFHDETDCLAYLQALRWPEGLRCPRCASQRTWPMKRGLWLCQDCRHQTSVLAGTVFQDTKLPLATWFAAMWYVTSQKNGVSALGLQRVLGLGSYRTAWAMLHKLRRAMVRPGRDRLQGVVEVDETYWGGVETGGATGRLTLRKVIVAVAAQQDGQGIGRIRLRCLPDVNRPTLHGFIGQAVEPGSTVITDGFNAYRELAGYNHIRAIQRRQTEGEHYLPRVHRVMSLLKRWLMGTHQGSVGREHLDDYLNEFTFRFNRRKSASRGKLFYRLAQQAVQVEPAPYASLLKNHKP
jgi:transposase-like protein